MKSKTNKIKFALIVTTAMALVFSMPVMAGSEDDAIALWKQKYADAIRDLRFGSTFEKINAARLLGAHRKSEYIRLLGAELLNNMEQQKFLQMSTNDPFVKVHMAWALGEIEHPLAIPDLSRALDISMELVKKDNELVKQISDQQTGRNEAFQKYLDDTENKLRQERGLPAKDKDDPYKIQVVKMGYDRPGPLVNPGHAYPNSPDMYWSLSDEFKGQSYNYRFEDQRVRMEGGANWMNLVREIFASLGKIEHADAIDGVKKYLDSDYPIVRAYAAQSLGNIGRSVAAAPLALKEKYATEKNERVKIYMAWAILVNDKSAFEQYQDLLKFLQSPDDLQRYDCIRVLSDLAMGESEEPLKAALKVEHRSTLRRMLQQAIHRSKIDNILPVNY
ncbi:MAG: HEAT repeat domain-containing protein [Leptospiraceae bacterium]|nr:HEAT repeat domain-containing protein [Leptospiraceae bacterium]